MFGTGRYAQTVNKQEAQLRATRDMLYALIKESRHTFREVSAAVGERHDTLSTRLRRPETRGYGGLDASLIVNVAAYLGVSPGALIVAAETLAAESAELSPADYVKRSRELARTLLPAS